MFENRYGEISFRSFLDLVQEEPAPVWTVADFSDSGDSAADLRLIGCLPGYYLELMAFFQRLIAFFSAAYSRYCQCSSFTKEFAQVV